MVILKYQSRLQQTTFINIFNCFFSEKIDDVLSESSARQRIHMKNQALFSLKDMSKKLKCRLLQILFGALRVRAECVNRQCHLLRLIVAFSDTKPTVYLT